MMIWLVMCSTSWSIGASIICSENTISLLKLAQSACSCFHFLRICCCSFGTETRLQIMGKWSLWWRSSKVSYWIKCVRLCDDSVRSMAENDRYAVKKCVDFPLFIMFKLSSFIISSQNFPLLSR